MPISGVRCAPRGATATIGGVLSQCPPLWSPLMWFGMKVVLGHDPKWQCATPTSGVRDNCGGISQPSADHARSTPSPLSHTGGATPAAPSCRVLGRDSDQASGHCPDFWAVADAGQVCSQGSESNDMWCLFEVLFFLLTPEVTGAAGGAYLHAPSDGKPCLLLASEMTAVVHPFHL